MCVQAGEVVVGGVNQSSSAECRLGAQAGWPCALEAERGLLRRVNAAALRCVNKYAKLCHRGFKGLLFKEGFYKKRKMMWVQTSPWVAPHIMYDVIKKIRVTLQGCPSDTKWHCASTFDIIASMWCFFNTAMYGRTNIFLPIDCSAFYLCSAMICITCCFWMELPAPHLLSHMTAWQESKAGKLEELSEQSRSAVHRIFMK